VHVQENPLVGTKVSLDAQSEKMCKKLSFLNR
jgi:hypothetical protein